MSRGHFMWSERNARDSGIMRRPRRSAMRQEALVTVKVAHLLIAFVLLSGSRTLAQPLPDPPELGVISSEFWAPCDCYYDDECKETGKCSPGNCSPGMEDTDSPLDGRCRSAPPFSTEQLEQVAKAVELYFQAAGYPLDSGDPKILWLGSERLGVPIGDDRAVGRRLYGHRLLHQPVEELAPTA